MRLLSEGGLVHLNGEDLGRAYAATVLEVQVRGELVDLDLEKLLDTINFVEDSSDE